MAKQHATNPDLASRIEDLEMQYFKIRTELAALRSRLEPVDCHQGYVFTATGGRKVSIGDVFGRDVELVIIHSMGESSSYSTLWCDGFNGLTAHIETRCAFVVVSDDPPEVQAEQAQRRSWNFRMLSSVGTTFQSDLGFGNAAGSGLGASTFLKKPDGRVAHYASTQFGPGDPFCAAWHLFDLLPEGEHNWRPRLI